MDNIKSRKSEFANSLIEASHYLLITINTEGKVTGINKATVTITGKSREKLIGSDFFDYFSEPQKAREYYQEVLLKGFVTGTPLTLQNYNGKLTDDLLNGAVYKNGSGSVLGPLFIVRNNTEQNRIAEELKDAQIFVELASKKAEEAHQKAENAKQLAQD